LTYNTLSLSFKSCHLIVLLMNSNSSRP